MGIFNIGGMAASAASVIQKPTILDKLKLGYSDFEKIYQSNPIQNPTAKTQAVTYISSPTKKTNTNILLIGGGIAVVAAIILLK